MAESTKASRACILELCVPTFLIGVALAFLWDSKKITAQSFDSLGPAPIPRLICWCVIILCIVVIGQTLYALRKARSTASSTAIPGRDPEAQVEPKPSTQAPQPKTEAQAETPPNPQPLLALATLGLTAAYVAIMAYNLLSFAIATVLYLLLTIGVLNRFGKVGMLIALAIALVMGFGCQYLFTEIFVIDLPTGVN